MPKHECRVDDCPYRDDFYEKAKKALTVLVILLFASIVLVFYGLIVMIFWHWISM